MHLKNTINLLFLGCFLCESDSELQRLVRSQKQISFVQIETVLLCEIGCGVSFLNLEHSSQRRILLSGAAPSALRSASDSNIQARCD